MVREKKFYINFIEFHGILLIFIVGQGENPVAFAM